MKLKEIIELRPQCAPIESGAEPSLRQLIEKYYQPYFPDDCQDYVEEYLTKLEELLGETVNKSPLKTGDLVRVVFDSKEFTPESFRSEGVDIGDVGVVGHIDNSDFPVNVLFNDGKEIGFNEEELERV